MCDFLLEICGVLTAVMSDLLEISGVLTVGWKMYVALTVSHRFFFLFPDPGIRKDFGVRIEFE